MPDRKKHPHPADTDTLVDHALTLVAGDKYSGPARTALTRLVQSLSPKERDLFGEALPPLAALLRARPSEVERAIVALVPLARSVRLKARKEAALSQA